MCWKLMRWATALAATAFLLVGPATGAQSAGSITKAQATAVALKALKPRPGTHVYALPAPVAATTEVGEGVSGPVRPAGRRAWVFWADAAPGAFFQHPSRLLLVDAGSGRVVRAQQLRWWPVVGKKVPPFVLARTSAAKARHQVWPTARRTAGIARSTSSSAGSATTTTRRALPPAAFASDCLVMIGPFDDPLFKDGFAAWEGWAKGLGMKAYRADADADGAPGPFPSADDLSATVEKARKAGCTDVVIYLAGHGTAPPAGKADPFDDDATFDGNYPADRDDIPTVSMVPTSEGRIIGTQRNVVTSRQLRSVIDGFAAQKVSFKVVVESCFSGRFLSDLRYKTPANLQIALVSSSSREVSFGHIVGSGPLDLPRYRNGRLVIERTDVEVPAGRGATGAGEFTKGILGGWAFWAASSVEVQKAQAQSAQAGTPLVVLGLRAAFRNRGPYDLAFQNGLTHPALLFDEKRAPDVPEVSLGGRGTLSRTGTNASFALANTGREPIQCWQLTLPAGVLATGISAPPAGWQLGSSQPPPAPTIGGQNRTVGLPAGATQTFAFTTNVPLTGGATLRISANCSTDVTAPVSGP
jgi:hypothetical protein